MIQKLKMTLLSLSALFMFAAPIVAVGTVNAQTPTIKRSLCDGVEFKVTDPDGPGTGTCASGAEGNLQGLITRIINVISVIVGVIAVIMIIFGGFRYITSAGNDTNVAAAKNTILYALIGLIIVALAQVIVKFVLQNTPG